MAENFSDYYAKGPEKNNFRVEYKEQWGRKATEVKGGSASV
jgi:hypothetical protein